MADFGRVVGERVVRFERLLPGPVERVWAYLTESDKRARWLAGGDADLRDGGRIELNFHNGALTLETPPEKYSAHAGEIRSEGRILRCEPPRVLAFSWEETHGEASEVHIELTPRGDHVLLVLTHSKLRDTAAMLDVSGGWHAHLALLEDHLSAREPRPFWTTLADAEAEYARRYSA